MFALTTILFTAFTAVATFFGYTTHGPHFVDPRVSNYSNFSVRLVGGFEPFNGRLEVAFDNWGGWGGVCYDKFDWRDASAACHSLGFFDAYPQVDVVRKPNASAFLANVTCRPGDEYLQQCTFVTDYPWGMNCLYNLQVYLTCHPRIGPRPTTSRPGPTTAPTTNKTIGISVCTDPFCATGTCNRTATVPQGVCFGIGQGQSQLAKCVKRPGQRCARVTTYNGTCSNTSALFAQPQTCGVCSPDPYGQYGKLTDCFDNSNFVTYMYGCNKQCDQCTTFKRFNKGACTPLAGVLLSFDGVETCETQIAFRNYADANCMNASTPLEMVTADRCLGQVGYGVRYTCNGIGMTNGNAAPHVHVPVGMLRPKMA